jgi:ABC-type uncharacterized transport system substrate-binding protein
MTSPDLATIDRRAFLGGLGLSVLAAPLDVEAQRPGKIARIGYLSASAPATDGSWVVAFEQGLRELGYVEGNNVVIERRHAAGQSQKLAELAAELVRLKLDVIVTFGGIEAIKKASSVVPVVMTVHADPVRAGVVASLAHPGGQVTGLSDLHAVLAPKRLELLKEVSPSISRVAVLFNPAGTVQGPGQLKDLADAALSLGLSLLRFSVTSAEDIDRAFAAMNKEQIGGITMVGDAQVLGLNRRQIVDLAIKNRLPAIGTVRAWAEFGLLMSYGTDFHELWRRAATYVDKILKGAKPGDLPVEQPTKFELVINIKTAKALGLTIPQSVLVRAVEIIQ